MRWSGAAHIEDCVVEGNGGPGFQVRGSVMGGVLRKNNREINNNADKRGFGVNVYASDPARTAVVTKGSPGKVVTVASVQRAVGKIKELSLNIKPV